MRKCADGGCPTSLWVIDYVSVARDTRQGSTPKLMNTMTGQWRVVKADKQHVYGVQNIVLGEVKEEHVPRMRYYAGDT